MNYKRCDAPHINYNQSVKSVMGDMVLSLLVLYAIAFYYYGRRALYLGMISVAACMALDILCSLIRTKKASLKDFSPIVTGLMIPLMLPSVIPVKVVLTACVFAIIAAKHAFGGLGSNIFNPAAAGLAFAYMSFPDIVSLFVMPMTRFSKLMIDSGTLAYASTPLFTLKLGSIPKVDYINMLLGEIPGLMGATNILVVLACLLYLVLRKNIKADIPLVYFGVITLLSIILLRPGMSIPQAVLYELMSGSIIFTGVFMLTDPATCPKNVTGRILYAVTAAVLTIIYRRFGNITNITVFVVLLANVFTDCYDRLGENVSSILRRKRLEH